MDGETTTDGIKATTEMDGETVVFTIHGDTKEVAEELSVLLMESALQVDLEVE
jgi:hypothetical protein